jgi:hypothetical protein
LCNLVMEKLSIRKSVLAIAQLTNYKITEF